MVRPGKAMILVWTLLFESHAPQAAALPMSFAPLDLQDDGKRGKKKKKQKQKQVSDFKSSFLTISSSRWCVIFEEME